MGYPIRAIVRFADRMILTVASFANLPNSFWSLHDGYLRDSIYDLANRDVCRAPIVADRGRYL